MSSNFTVTRLCEQCGNTFLAKTTVTRFCSKACNKKSYVNKVRGTRMAPMDKVIQKVLNKAAPDLSAHEFLSVKDAAKLLGASEKIIYTMIRTGRLNAVNLSQRKTTVYRKDIDKLFELPVKKTEQEFKPEIADCYHMGEAQEVFRVSESTLYNLIKRNNIPKYQVGKFTYVVKTALHQIFNN